MMLSIINLLRLLKTQSKKSQFYLFTALLLISLTMSYFSLNIISSHNSPLIETSFFDNLYIESQKAYNQGASNNNFLQELESLYDSGDDYVSFDLIESNIEPNNENNLIFKDYGLKNLADFAYLSSFYLLSKNKDSFLVWYVKKSFLIENNYVHKNYLIINSNLSQLKKMNFHVIDETNSNIFYFYDNTEIPSESFFNENQNSNRADINTFCSLEKKCLNHYVYSPNLLPNYHEPVVLFELNFPFEELCFGFVKNSEPIKICLNNKDMENNIHFGFIAVVEDKNGVIQSFVKSN